MSSIVKSVLAYLHHTGHEITISLCSDSESDRNISIRVVSKDKSGEFRYSCVAPMLLISATCQI